ncbi:MAG: hypothetical protein ACFE8N_10250, partial [Promethearchaeota archaeon]
MPKRVRNQIIFIVFIITVTSLIFLPIFTKFSHEERDKLQYPKYSASLEGAENVLITDVYRIANISGYGLFSIEDAITVKNLNNNPITSIFFGIQLNLSDNLIYFEAVGNDRNTLLSERSFMIMNDFEMIAIYFDTPLLPQQTKTVRFIQQFKDLLKYEIIDANQYIIYKGLVYPTLPYRMERNLDARFFVPLKAAGMEGGWGFEQPDLYFIRYDFSFIGSSIPDPYILHFLENLHDYKDIEISFYKNEKDLTLMELEQVNREIFISPWGIIRVDEELTIKNNGLIVMESIFLKLPRDAKDVYVSDDIGEILGVSIADPSSLGYKQLKIDLVTNRVRMIPNSSFHFKIRYYLAFENYFSINWIQESIEIDIYSTVYEYLVKQQNIEIKIDGCFNVDFITEPPEAIKKADGSTSLFYTADIVPSIERKVIQFTFTLDLFDLLLRPISFILIISLISAIFVLTVKTRRKEDDTPTLAREFIPVNEIREFCALYEEKIASNLEIRQAEEDAKRRKIAKKNYKNILSKNTSKIDEIQKEIIPFKKVLLDTSETFSNIINKLDVLEAERMSIKDSLNLLETRYKRGRLPSKAAYLKLS